MSEELKSLLQRVESGTASEAEEARMDELLAAGGQTAMRRTVEALPEDAPSLEWRSALNEELRRLAPRPRRIGWWVRPAWGVALAGALSLVIFLPRDGEQTGEPVPALSLEASLVGSHREYVHSTDLAGAGLTPQDIGVAHKARLNPSPYDWVEGDLAL